MSRVWEAMREAEEAKRCSYIFELDDCDFEDSFPRPGDLCGDDADEACLHHCCTHHCKDPECLAHKDEDVDDSEEGDLTT